MSAIDKITAKLTRYPQLKYKAEENHISIDAPTESGFSVWLTVNNPGFTVGFDAWHEEFEDEDEALNAFASGLSDERRLKVTKRGKTECAWTVEYKDGDQWNEENTTGLFFFPFWRKKTVEYRQNDVLNHDS